MICCENTDIDHKINIKNICDKLNIDFDKLGQSFDKCMIRENVFLLIYEDGDKTVFILIRHIDKNIYCCYQDVFLNFGYDNLSQYKKTLYEHGGVYHVVVGGNDVHMYSIDKYHYNYVDNIQDHNKDSVKFDDFLLMARECDFLPEFFRSNPEYVSINDDISDDDMNLFNNFYNDSKISYVRSIDFADNQKFQKLFLVLFEDGRTKFVLKINERIYGFIYNRLHSDKSSGQTINTSSVGIFERLSSPIGAFSPIAIFNFSYLKRSFKPNSFLEIINKEIAKK